MMDPLTALGLAGNVVQFVAMKDRPPEIQSPINGESLSSGASSAHDTATNQSQSQDLDSTESFWRVL